MRHVPGHPAPGRGDPGALGSGLGHARPRPLSLLVSTTGARPSPTALDATAFQSIARPDIMRWKYRKLLMNLANVVGRLWVGTAGRFSPLAKEAQARGRLAALAAAGIDVASAEEDRERRDDLPPDEPPRRRASGGAGRAGRAWPWVRLHRGRVPQRRDRPCWAASMALPTPVNALLGQRLAVRAAAENQPPGQLDDRGVEPGGRRRARRVSGGARTGRRLQGRQRRRHRLRPQLPCGRALGQVSVPGEDWRLASSCTTSPRGTGSGPRAGCGR